MKPTSTKINAQYLAQLLKQHGCTTIVVAPGSRNAPMLIAFAADEEYTCVSVPDERVAAFTAMGMTLDKREPVAVICSSGSATVNFYPAVVEAFYQGLPLVVITADRPKELIDQGIGQTIRQEFVFDNHIVHNANLLRQPQDETGKAYNQRLINEALFKSSKGPVHINVPFDEPLYETTSEVHPARLINELRGEKVLRLPPIERLANVWNNSPKIWVLAGQLLPDDELENTLNALNLKSPFLIFSESLSNLHCGCNIHCIDRLINTLSEEEKKALQPDLLISIGGEVVSKMVKKYLRSFTPKAHWYVEESSDFQDTFGALTEHVQVHPALFFKELTKQVKPKNTAWRDGFLSEDEKRKEKQKAYLTKAPYSDFTVFDTVLKHIPNDSILHCANSTAVRYAQLFDHPKELLHFSNRGTSGIDGCTSTAIGHAMATDKMVTLITGDVAFLYDSNAFWNNQLPNNFRVIVLNNEGGNIFRIIPGPTDNEMFNTLQETVHHHNLEGVAKTYGVDFISVGSLSECNTVLESFYASHLGPKILEVKTPRLESPNVLKDYFKYLSNN